MITENAIKTFPSPRALVSHLDMPGKRKMKISSLVRGFYYIGRGSGVGLPGLIRTARLLASIRSTPQINELPQATRDQNPVFGSKPGNITDINVAIAVPVGGGC